MRLCRPERLNAHTPATWRALATVPQQLSDDVRVIVVTGEGRAFSAGLDRRMFTPEGVPGEGSLTDITDRSQDDAADVVASFQAGFAWLRSSNFVSVAAVQGHAVGAGFQLALACDIRIVADDVQFTMAEPSVGLVPDLGGTYQLVATVGYARAIEICATGRRVGAAEAERIGLANLVVPAGDLESATDELVAALHATNRDAVRDTKALLLTARDNHYDAQLHAERLAQLHRIRALTS